MTTTSCSGVPSVFCAVIQERKAGRAVDGSLALYPYKDRIRVRIRSWIPALVQRKGDVFDGAAGAFRHKVGA